MSLARTRILLSTLFVALVGVGATCDSAEPKAPIPEGPPLPLYDEAVALFFKAPRDPERAVRLLEGACKHLAERRAQSCYNWGLFLEMLGRPGDAREAYAQAAQLEDLPVYRSAVWALDPDRGPKSPRLAALREAAAHCQNDRPARALRLLKSVAASAKLTRQLVGQPFFRSCLHREAGYKPFLAGLPSAKGRLANDYYRAVAGRDAFRRLWDLEARLRGTENSSRHAVTREWQAALAGAARGDAARTARHLEAFLAQLPVKGVDAARAQSLRRAAGLVVQQTRYFARVRRHPAVRNFVRKAVR